MHIEKPIFIIGTGRSGTTMVHEILCNHPNLTWFSVLLSVFPSKIRLNKLYMQLIDLPIIGTILKKYIIPTESYQFWENYAKGFSKPFRDLTENDLTVKVKETIPKIFSKTLTKKRNRLLIKITGWPRIGYILKIFPDAKFIHIKRDSRAVTNSFLNVYFWKGWEGPNNWRWGNLTEEQKVEWEKHDKSFVALAAINYKIMDNAINKAVNKLNQNQFLEINYEDICENPVQEFNKMLEFTEIKKSKPFNKFIKKQKIRNTNYKLEKELTENQKFILNDVLNKI
ncbi:MAG: sulfotransferase [Bacteroidales bacterium]|nr:sulfotransferase [Bacteroidales bacterium]MBN2756500.1 sulfotransferase [Bacteroidales bacterium]